MKSLKLFALIIVIVLLALLSAAYFGRTAISDLLYSATKEPVPEPLTALEIKKNGTPPRALPLSEEQAIVSPAKESPQKAAAANELPHFAQATRDKPAEINLAVPFTSQAPFANWDLPYKESCEEASVLMLDYFYRNLSLNPSLANQEILKLVDWQKIKFGAYEDTDAAQTAQILREYFGYKNVRVQYDISIDDIRKELAQGRPVIVPAAGQLLPNPFFRQPGPLYHMLVIKGYKNGKFITNDPGTRRGADFIYSYEGLYNAIHDWNDGNVYSGRKAMIVVED